MERDAGSVRLTSKGQQLLEYSRKILKATDNLIEAADRSMLFDDVLRLGVTEMIVHTWLRDFLKVFKQAYPNVTVELTVDLSVNLENELMERSIDLALQSGPFNWKSTGSRNLDVYPLIWIASPKTKFNPQNEVAIGDLIRYPILTHARGTQPFKEVEAHFKKRQESSVRLVPSSNLAACIHMAIDGFGVATVPAAMVINELQSGELFQLNYNWAPKSLDFFARYDAEKSPQFVVKAGEIAAQVAESFTTQLKAKGKSSKAI